MSKTCDKHAVPMLLVDGEWECPFCIADFCSDLDADFSEFENQDELSVFSTVESLCL